MSKKIWQVLYIIFAKHLPVSRRMKLAKKFRCFFARRICKYVGKDVNIEKGAHFGPDISIDDYSGIGVNCEFYTSGNEIIIGKYVMVGPEVVIYTSMHKSDDINTPMMFQGYTKKLPVKIGNDVWIGQRAIIMPGVEIGDGAIIGTNAVVTKDVPPYAIVGGIPAKVIKMRNATDNKE
ncbi:MAG: CatB-related O-acetyltransferase [Ruminococcaceae bacterium]|nr:CatB-related O-acetyltransferase [Oscillospiraceae bacterium]